MGILLGRGMVRLITQTINDFYFVVNVYSVDVPLWTLLKGILIGVAAAVISSFVPALEAARTTPQSTLQRSTLESRVQRVLPWLWLAWALLTALGILLLWIRTGLVIMFAGLLSMPVGYIFAWILIYVINVRSFGWALQMQLEPAYFLQAFMVAVGGALLAGKYPSWEGAVTFQGIRAGQPVTASGYIEMTGYAD